MTVRRSTRWLVLGLVGFTGVLAVGLAAARPDAVGLALLALVGTAGMFRTNRRRPVARLDRDHLYVEVRNLSLEIPRSRVRRARSEQGVLALVLDAGASVRLSVPGRSGELDALRRALDPTREGF